ncbi:MAG TPA: hypothetical protein VFF67_10085 [Thermoplasmata archaeon]|nr:hypothetical protein [Thermoplasmata archaeon]
MHAATPLTTIVFYAILVLALLYATTRTPTGDFPVIAGLLIGVLLLFLVRFLTTTYVLDSDDLRAVRLLGFRRVHLEEVRKIEFASLRDLGGGSFFGGWGWRGRMWSPIIGQFDSIATVSQGILVTAGKVPLFVSPRDNSAFARELSRRVRSYRDDLEVDAGREAIPRF